MANYWVDISGDELITSGWQDIIKSSHGVKVPSDDIETIQEICDIKMEAYKNGNGGTVTATLPYRPKMKYKEIVSEAEKLSSLVDRSNLSIGIVADDAGIEASGILASHGISVNMLEIYSPSKAQIVADKLSDESIEGVVHYVSTSVSPYDAYLNSKLKQHNLAQNRIGFFVASKIYNLIEEKNIDNVKIIFDKLNIADSALDEAYYIENLNLPGAGLMVSMDLYDQINNREFDESFHFQNRHLDAFFGFLAPAQISLTQVEEELFRQATNM